jgi:TRAP-type C4-dicarboxylate transport system permease small subunit
LSGELATPRAAVLALRIEKFLDALIGLILAVITVSLIYQVFGRYVLHSAPGWTEEVSRMLIVWLTMLGAGACLRGGSHIAVTVLVNALPDGLRHLVLWVRDIAILLTVGVLAWAGARFALLNATQDSPALEIPMAYAYSSLCIGAVLVALQLALSRIGREPPTIDPIEW